MARTKNSRLENYVFVEVIQNGELIDEFSFPFRKSGSVRLSSQKGAELSVPEYPLARSYLMLKKISKDRGMIFVPQDWTGFVTSLGEVQDINLLHSSEKRYEVGVGDYGSLSFRDLTMLFKIKPKSFSLKHRVKADGTYRGSLFSLIKSSKDHFGVMAVAMAAALFIWGSFTAGLLVRNDDLPKTYSDLEERYVLPFLSADHLRNIPEANQKFLYRRNYIQSTLDYYHSFSQMVLGYEVDDSKFLFPNNMAAFRSYYNDQQDRVEDITKKQLDLDEQVKKEASIASLRIPAVKGSAAAQDLSRLIRTLDGHHAGLEVNLNARRKFKQQFTSDKNYDMTMHGNIPPVSTGPNSADISIAGIDDDETTMYRSAAELARKAAIAKKYIDARKTKMDFPADSLTPTIRISGPMAQSTFIQPERYEADSSKLDSLIAAEFSTRKKQKVKEPLTGELDPGLVSKTIDQRKFELQLCYELALRRDQKTIGKMEFSWRIDSRGKISELKLLASTIRDKRMVNCVRQKIASWKFPRPRRGSIKIKYPFSFKPRRG